MYTLGIPKNRFRHCPSDLLHLLVGFFGVGSRLIWRSLTTKENLARASELIVAINNAAGLGDYFDRCTARAVSFYGTQMHQLMSMKDDGAAPQPERSVSAEAAPVAVERPAVIPTGAAAVAATICSAQCICWVPGDERCTKVSQPGSNCLGCHPSSCGCNCSPCTARRGSSSSSNATSASAGSEVHQPTLSAQLAGLLRRIAGNWGGTEMGSGKQPAVSAATCARQAVSAISYFMDVDEYLREALQGHGVELGGGSQWPFPLLGLNKLRAGLCSEQIPFESLKIELVCDGRP